MGVIEADKVNIDYTNCMSDEGIAYLWYGGGTYYGNGQSETMRGMIIHKGDSLDIYLDLMIKNEITFGNDKGKIFEWPRPSLAQVKKDKDYRLAVVSYSSGAATTVEIIEFNVEYKPIIR